MTAIVFTNAFIEINGVDWSNKATSVTLNLEGEDVETTTFGGNGFRSRIMGLKDGSVDIEFVNDFDDNSLDESLWALWGTVVNVTIRPDAGAVGPNNAEYSGNVLVNEMTPIDGSVGDLATRSVSWPIAGAWTRAVS